MIQAPCKDCERKGCGLYHSQCEKYNQFKKEKDAENKAYKRDKENHVKIRSDSV